MLEPPTIDDIRAAEERIKGAVIKTPMLVSRTLSEIIGAEDPLGVGMCCCIVLQSSLKLAER